MSKLTVNGQMREFDAEPDTPLLWVLREQLDLTGSKYGCGIGQCGACTVHIDGAPTRSCVLPLSAVGPDAKVVTIEGLSSGTWYFTLAAYTNTGVESEQTGAVSKTIR